MSRPLRIEYEGALYHVTARGNERRKIFLDERDYGRFTQLLERNVERHAVLLHAYALMPNHYHLLAETPNANLSSFMHDLQASYAGWFNSRRRRAGHLFQGRYKAIVVEKESYLLELHRYIHLNPVRASLVKKPAQWKWSSYADYIRPDKRTWVWRDDALSLFGRSRSRAAARYREFVEDALTRPPEDPLSKVVGQIVLGSGEFLDGIKARLSQHDAPPLKEVPSAKYLRRWNEQDVEKALKAAAEYYGVSTESLREKHRPAMWPRDAAITMFRRHSRLPLGDIGNIFSISESAVCKTAKRVEQAMGGSKTLRKEAGELYSRIKT